MARKVTKENYVNYITNSVMWRRKRIKVLKERGRRCEICKSPTNKPEVHHLHYDNLGDEAMRDLQVLCGECHGREHRLRDPDTFTNQKSLTDYIDKLDPIEANWRFPKYWIETEKWLSAPKSSSKPSVPVKSISIDGLTMLPAKPRPQVEPDRFFILQAADFKCEFCGKQLKHNAFHVSQGKASCGCDMAAAYMKDKVERPAFLKTLGPVDNWIDRKNSTDKINLLW